MTKSPLLAVLDEREDKAIDTCTTCPTLCRWSCPVAEAEARETSSPHRLTILSGLLKTRRATVETVRTLPYHCSHCHACTQACLHDNDVPLVLSMARQRVVTEGGAPAGVREVCGHFGVSGNPQGTSLEGPVRRIAEAAGAPVHRTAPTVYLPGCETIASEPDAAVSFLRAASLFGARKVALTPSSSACCGLPLFWAGELDGFAGHAARFASQLQGAEKIVVHDAACGHALKHRYADVGVKVTAKIEHVSTFLARRLPNHSVRPDIPKTALLETCGLSRGLGEHDAPRTILAHALGTPPIELGAAATGGPLDCCGAAGLLPLSAPATATAMAEARIEAFRATGAERLAVSSPRCAAHLKSVDPRIEIVDPTTLLAQI
ncbi:MAG: (Fe-S)-binding protein [Deltaproteobacteria bacterium]